MQIPREIRLHTGMLCDMFLNNVTAALPRLYLVFTLSIRHNCCPLDWSRLGVDERHVRCSLSSVTPGGSLTTSIRTNLPLHRSATADRRGLAFNVLAQHKDPGALQDCLRSLWVYARVMLVTSATVIKKVFQQSAWISFWLPPVSSHHQAGCRCRSKSRGTTQYSNGICKVICWGTGFVVLCWQAWFCWA